MKELSIDMIPAIRAKFPGKQIAFWVHDIDAFSFAVLTVCVKDEPGHSPLPWQLANGSHAEMARHAEHLNDVGLGLTFAQAHAYVSSTMQGKQAADREPQN